MSGSIGNALQAAPAPAPAVPAPGPARPLLNPLQRFGPTGGPVAQGPRLPAYALRVPSQNALVPAPAPPPVPAVPAVPQPPPRVPHPPEPERSDYGLEHQVPIRIPKLDDKAIDGMRQRYAHVNTSRMSNEEAAEAMTGHVHDNVVSLWNQIRDKPWLQEAVHAHWGENRRAHDLSQQYGMHVPGGLSHRQAAAAMAALSPQTDRVERLLDVVRDHKDTPFDDRMRDFVRTQMEGRKNPALREDGLAALARIPEGAKFKDLTEPEHQAFFAGAHDQGPGGSFHALENAFKALKSDKLKDISNALGDKHHIRSLYNNIIAPDSPEGHVTIDTNTLHAGQLMPSTAHLGPVPHAMYDDAYRRAANTIGRLEGRRYLPREVQSAVGEAVKGLFDGEGMGDTHAGEPVHHVGKVAKHMFTLARYGVTPPAQARQAVYNHAGGVSDPEWFREQRAREIAQRMVRRR